MGDDVYRKSNVGYICLLCEATKPPLGVMPRKMWDKQRLKDLADAMFRYLEAGMKIPAEWIEEYNEIGDRFKED